MPFELDPGLFDIDECKGLSIKIVGAGGFGCSAVNAMIDKSLDNVEYVAFHTDPNVLLDSKAPVRIRLGKRPTNDRERILASAATANRPSITDEDRNRIANQLQGADIVMLAAGMGKGTGTWLTPLIAMVARNMGVLTIGIVTTPFSCEGKAKAKAAEEGLAELRKFVDTLVTIDNESILNEAVDKTTVSGAFDLAGDVVYRTAKSIADILTSRGHINVSFADVADLMAGAGDAAIATASAVGAQSALRSAREALAALEATHSPIRRARGIMVNITGSVSMKDLSEAMSCIESQVGRDTRIVNGYIDEKHPEGSTRTTLIVTGVSRLPQERQKIAEAVPAANIPIPDYSTPAYIRRRLSVEGLDREAFNDAGPDDHAVTANIRKDRINKSLPEQPAFLRIIAERD